MKAVHIILLFATLGLAQAQHTFPPVANVAAVDMQNSQHARTLSSYYDHEKERKASWYVSTDPTTLQTSILFMDKDQRVIYEEKLPGQFVELTSYNRRVLDQTLARLTSRQLVTDKLKTKDFPSLQQSTFEDLNTSLPVETATTEPTGLMSRVFITPKKSLYVWAKNPAPQRTTLHIKAGSGRTLRVHTAKGEQFTNLIPLTSLPEGNYSIRLYGKTWEQKYQLRLWEESGKRLSELLPL